MCENSKNESLYVSKIQYLQHVSDLQLLYNIISVQQVKWQNTFLKHSYPN